MKLHPVEAERAPCGRTYEWTGKQDKGKSRSHKINFFVLRGSNNKQRLLIVYFFFNNRERVFTARYELNVYAQLRLFFAFEVLKVFLLL